MAQPVTIDLTTLFTTSIATVTELNLSAAYPAGTHKPLIWHTQDGEIGTPEPPRSQTEKKLKDTSVTLNPLEIRTFAVTF